MAAAAAKTEPVLNSAATINIISIRLALFKPDTSFHIFQQTDGT